MAEIDKRELGRRLAKNGMELVRLNGRPGRYVIDDTLTVRRIAGPMTLADAEKFAAYMFYQVGGVGGPFFKEAKSKPFAVPPKSKSQPAAPARGRAKVVLDDEVV